MFKNCVLKPDVNTVQWAKKAGMRAAKTFAQTLAGFITVGASVGEINWGYALSVAAVAYIYSMVTSVAGIPETEGTEEKEKTKEETKESGEE